MATSVAPMASNDSVGNLQALLNLYGSAKGSSTSTTTQSNLSSTNVSALIQSILGSNQGLASVAAGQKNAGMYNSSTNQMLINDLLSRVTTQTAAQTAGSTTTQRTAGKLGGNDLLTMFASYAGGKVLGPSLKKFNNPLDTMGDKLADYLSGGSGAGGMAPAASETLTGAGAEMAAGSNAASIGLSGAELAGSGTAAGVGAEGALTAALSDEAVAAGGAYAGSLAAVDGFGTAAAAAGGTEVAGAALASEAGAAISWEAIGTWIASLFSDERLKTDIKPVGETTAGQAIYTYKYKDNPFTTHMGVMAQETRPEAVVRDPSGYLRVNYDKLLGVD